MANKFAKLKIFFIDEDGKTIPETDDLYKIYGSVVVPGHLKNVKFRRQDFDTLNDGLIFTGEDSKERVQYYYGKNHVINRKDSRLDIVMNTHERYPIIEQYIKTHISGEFGKEFLFAILLQLEMVFYIRMGKEKYFKENGTIGLNTLQKSHITITKDFIGFNFTGKTGVEQSFKMSVKHKLAKHILMLYRTEHPFLFTTAKGVKLSESFIYNKMKEFDVKIKDLRTYGANKIFISEWGKLVKEKQDELASITSNKKTTLLKQMTKMAIDNTAKIIGHEPTTCKTNYLIKEILELTMSPWFSNPGQTFTITNVLGKVAGIHSITKEK